MEFYYLSFSILFSSISLSLYRCFYMKENEIDFNPTTQDKNKYKKILWYFSQFTYSSNFIFFIYYMLKIVNYNCNSLFVLISPILLSVNINYFLILYPKKNIKLYELEYQSLIHHLINTFIILYEIKNIIYYSYLSILLFNYYIAYGILITFINFYYRNIWTYDIANLYTLSGWKLFLQFYIVSFIMSLLLYSINYFLLNNFIK
jgi:hypothetical protein